MDSQIFDELYVNAMYSILRATSIAEMDEIIKCFAHDLREVPTKLDLLYSAIESAEKNGVTYDDAGAIFFAIDLISVHITNDLIYAPAPDDGEPSEKDILSKRLDNLYFEFRPTVVENFIALVGNLPSVEMLAPSHTNALEQAIKEYLAGAGSLRDIQLKYKILSPDTLRKWILKYNNGIILTDYKPMSEVYTMKSRKVSYEERIEIVNYCIANNYDYKGTADKYNVPYSQVYTWVQKVKENGYESLVPKKKGAKPKNLVEPQTKEELLQLEIERLRREKERLELEVEVLKKKHRLQKRANIRK